MAIAAEQDEYSLASVPLLPLTGTVFSETIAIQPLQTILNLISNHQKWDSWYQKIS